MSVTDPMRPGYNTEHLGLPVPGDAGAADQHQVISDLAERLDALAAAGFLQWEPGDLKASAKATPPTGWLLCNGQAVSRTVYAALFAAIGTNYGAGDGGNTFNVPNFNDTTLMGASGGRPRGTRGGAAAVALTAGQSGCPGGTSGWQSADHAHYTSGGTGWDDPDHDHGIGGWEQGTNATNGAGVVIARVGAPAWVWRSTGASARHAHAFGAWSGGVNANHQHGYPAQNAGAAHENLPPFVTCNVFIKT